MSQDRLTKHSRRNWGLGPRVATPRDAAPAPAPSTWRSEKEVDDELHRVMASGGLFGTPLPREAAERKTLEIMRDRKISVLSGTMGSWLLSAKDQKKIFDKVDDVRYDVRLFGQRIGIGLGCLAGALGLLGIANIYKTSSQQNPRK